MRYRNPHPHTAVLPEHRTDGGQLIPTVAVEPGEELDWPVPIASFEPAADERASAAPKKAAAAVSIEAAGSAKAKGSTEAGA